MERREAHLLVQGMQMVLPAGEMEIMRKMIRKRNLGRIRSGLIRMIGNHHKALTAQRVSRTLSEVQSSNLRKASQSNQAPEVTNDMIEQGYKHRLCQFPESHHREFQTADQDRLQGKRQNKSKVNPHRICHSGHRTRMTQAPFQKEASPRAAANRR